MKQQCVLLAALLVSSALAGPCETDEDCGGNFFCNCNFVCDKCDENGENCQAESVSGRPSGCTDNPGMDQGHDTPKPSPSPTGMFDGSDPDTPRDPGCCMALDWSVHDASKCINAYKVAYCNNEPGWENCEWIYDDDHVVQSDCEQPDDNHHDDDGVCDKKCMDGFECVFDDHGEAMCQKVDDEDDEPEDCGCTKELMPYCCDGQKYDNECLGYCAGAQECLGMKHPDNSCTDQSDSGDDEGCCMGDTERKMSMCSNSPSENNCNNMNGCHWSADCSVPAPPPGCCYASDPNNRKAADCYGVDYDKCAAGARMSCTWKEGEDADCSLPTPEPGCCYGSDSACDTDDQMMCEKNARRKGCEWRSGKDADCSPVPGCCMGGDDVCYGMDESNCAKNMRRKGCEWITGTTDCTPPAPEPGCCYASDPNNRKAADCYGLDDAACAKGARMSCAWMSGENADCSEPEPEQGCCMAETERKVNACSRSPSSTNCNNMNDCHWIDGADADCTWESSEDDGAMCCGDDSSKMNMCSNSMSMNNCNGMNGCHWVMAKDDCTTDEMQFLFAGEGVQEVMNSQVSLSTVLLSMLCVFALWKVYGWWSNSGDSKAKQFAQADGRGYYQSV